MPEAAGIGHNEAPDFARIETDRLEQDYTGLITTYTDLESEVGRVPASVNDDATALRVGGLIKRLRGLRERFEQSRLVEVEPSLRRQNAINTFFNSRRRSIQPDDKNERRTKPGLIDRLQKLIDEHQDRKEAEARAILAAKAAEAKRIADAARAEEERKQREADAAKQKADEAAAAVERTRTEEGRKKRMAEAEAANAAAAATAAEAKKAEVESAAADETAQDARIGTYARDQDLVRVQGNTDDGGGVMLTTGKESYCIMTDRSLLNTPETAAKLFKYFNDKEVEKALRSFARETNHAEQIPGAEIGWKKKGITR